VFYLFLFLRLMQKGF